MADGWISKGGVSETLIDVLLGHVERGPGRIAFRFLGDGEHEIAAWTYSELWARSRSVALILEACARPGDRALLLYPPGLDFVAAFLGCLVSGVAAVPLYAPHPRRPDARLASVAGDCAPSLILSDGETLERSRPALDREPALAGVARVATDRLDHQDGARGHRARAEDLAFIQYTSGSTGEPKGVCVTHANLLENVRMIQRAMRVVEETLSVSWLPTHHDMGLVGDTLGTIFSGCSSVKMPPAAFLQRPARWLRAASKYRASIIGAPNFAYDLCVRRTTDAERQDLDLSALRVTYCGAEPVRAASLLDFAEAFAISKFDRESFFPCYGLAEATLFVAGGPAARRLRTIDVARDGLQRRRVSAPVGGDDPSLVSCGEPAAQSDVVPIDPDSRARTDSDRIGEIWVRGPHVASGYWNRPEDSERTMRAFTADGAGPFLRTGDFGFLRDGELFITGRLRDLIIIRGRNHYPQDIERAASESHPLLTGGMGAAFTVARPDGETAVLVHEVARNTTGADVDAARKAVRVAVAETCDVQLGDIRFVRFGSVPRTTSGKVRRSATRDLYIGGELEVAPPSSSERPASMGQAPAVVS